MMKKIENLLGNRKAQIGETLVWMVATLVVIFMIIIFIVAVLFIAGKEKITFWKKGTEISIEKIQSKTELVALENTLSFLNTPVGEYGRIYDIVSNVDLEEGKEKRIEIFQKQGKVFLESNFPKEKYYRSWIRIYNVDEKIDQYYISKISKSYEISQSFRGEKGGIDCDPNYDNTIFIDIFISPNKLIALCANVE